MSRSALASKAHINALQLPENFSDMGSPYHLRIYGLVFLLVHTTLAISSPSSYPQSKIELSQPQGPLFKNDFST
jgi:hypothetical protein